jgi:hypothetical protein
LVRYVAYDGLGTGYLVAVLKPRKDKSAAARIMTTFYVQRNERIAVDDLIFDLLRQQGHFGPGKLREVAESELKRPTGIV